MSGKRSAPYTIDEKTLQPKENPEVSIANTQANHHDRTILKVKSAEAESSKDQKKQDGKGLIFANLFNKNNGVGLFNNEGLFSKGLINKPDFKINIAAPNLFTGNGDTKINNISPNIFTGNGPQATNSSIFPKNTSNQASLFKNEGKSIFGFGNGSALPPVRSGQADEDDDGQDSAQLTRKQDMVIDRSKSTGNYEYKSEMKILFSAHAKKYKKNDGDLIQNVEVIVQEKEETKLACVVVRLPATKHSILSGVLLRGKCQVRVINNKQENLQLSIFVFEQGKTAKREKLKLQFQTPATGKQFRQIVSNLIKPQESNGKHEEPAKPLQQKKEIASQKKQ